MTSAVAVAGERGRARERMASGEKSVRTAKCRAWRVPLVEHEIEDREHRAQPLRHLVRLGHDYGMPASCDLALRPHEPLRHRRRGHHESASDLSVSRPTSVRSVSAIWPPARAPGGSSEDLEGGGSSGSRPAMLRGGVLEIRGVRLSLARAPSSGGCDRWQRSAPSRSATRDLGFPLVAPARTAARTPLGSPLRRGRNPRLNGSRWRGPPPFRAINVETATNYGSAWSASEIFSAAVDLPARRSIQESGGTNADEIHALTYLDEKAWLSLSPGGAGATDGECNPHIEKHRKALAEKILAGRAPPPHAHGHDHPLSRREEAPHRWAVCRDARAARADTRSSRRRSGQRHRNRERVTRERAPRYRSRSGPSSTFPATTGPVGDVNHEQDVTHLRYRVTKRWSGGHALRRAGGASIACLSRSRCA